MFFRKALTTDFLELREKGWSTELKNCYLIEDESGILGSCIVEENSLQAIFIVDEKIKKEFLMMIEEYFFMAYDKLYSLDKSLEKFDWVWDGTKYCKSKPSQNPYTLNIE
ncbi:MAG: hypothetical protein ACRCTJ_07620 [Brevinema sp.]